MVDNDSPLAQALLRAYGIGAGEVGDVVAPELRGPTTDLPAAHVVDDNAAIEKGLLHAYGIGAGELGNVVSPLKHVPAPNPDPPHGRFPAPGVGRAVPLAGAASMMPWNTLLGKLEVVADATQTLAEVTENFLHGYRINTEKHLDPSIC